MMTHGTMSSHDTPEAKALLEEHTVAGGKVRELKDISLKKPVVDIVIVVSNEIQRNGLKKLEKYLMRLVKR